MRRSDMFFELIEVLRSARGPMSAHSIGNGLGVSKRTVYRDVATLTGQRVPIRGEPSVGYILEPGFHLPPLMLTRGETEAALLGGQWVQSRGAARGLRGAAAAGQDRSGCAAGHGRSLC